MKKHRLLALLLLLPLIAVVVAAYLYVQLAATDAARESAEYERAKAAAIDRP